MAVSSSKKRKKRLRARQRASKYIARSKAMKSIADTRTELKEQLMHGKQLATAFTTMQTNMTPEQRKELEVIPGISDVQEQLDSMLKTIERIEKMPPNNTATDASELAETIIELTHIQIGVENAITSVITAMNETPKESTPEESSLL